MTLKILIVDDEDELRSSLAESFHLEDEDIVCLQAVSGNGAMKILEKEKIDVILSDISMPDGDGMFLLRSINEIFIKNRPKIYFFSGYEKEVASIYMKNGANGFFEKPVSIQKILTEIKK